MNLDVAGAATHGALIAGAVERPSGEAGEAQPVCTDCGTPVIGRFCHQCGQPAHLHRSLLHLGEELLHGVMHFDSRVWRTLPLLAFRPGRLTREWVHGKRTRYVSPLALFLFTVFVLFMGLSYMPVEPGRSLTDGQAQIAARVVSKAAAVSRAEASLKAATPADRPKAEEDLRAARADLAEAQQDAAELRQITHETAGFQAKISSDARSGKLNLNLGNKKLEEKLRHKLENPELAIYKLQQSFYKFSFLLIPISIPFVALLFLWKRGFTLYDHAVFVLYSLTFVSVLVMLTAVAMRIGGAAAAAAVSIVPFAVPLHMFFQLKGAYGLGVWSALWRTWFLLWFCTFALIIFGLAVIYLGLI